MNRREVMAGVAAAVIAPSISATMDYGSSVLTQSRCVSLRPIIASFAGYGTATITYERSTDGETWEKCSEEFVEDTFGADP